MIFYIISITASQCERWNWWISVRWWDIAFLRRWVIRRSNSKCVSCWSQRIKLNIEWCYETVDKTMTQEPDNDTVLPRTLVSKVARVSFQSKHSSSRRSSESSSPLNAIATRYSSCSEMWATYWERTWQEPKCGTNQPGTMTRPPPPWCWHSPRT